MKPISRRNFLKKTGVAAAAFTLRGQHAHGFGKREFFHGPALKKDLTIPTICAMCNARCLVLARTRQGRLVKIDGNPKSPFNGLSVCARGNAAVKLLYDPDRLKYPLKRIGRRGEGKWARISWAEAIDTISFQMDRAVSRFGPESLALFVNGPSSAYINELFEELKVPNICNSSREHCNKNRDLAYKLTFGTTPGHPVRADFKNTECVVLLGSHFGENVDLPKLKDLLGAIENGAKLIVADPRFSAIASKADHYLRIKPGTDTALLLGWINFIIESGLYNVEFVAQNVVGFSELRKQASLYPLHRVAELTDIPLDELKRTAKLIARHAPATIIYPGNHSSWYGNDVQRLRAQAILTALLGSWGKKGGILLPASVSSAPSPLPDGGSPLSAAKRAEFLQKQSPNGPDILKKAIAGKLRFLGCWGQNPFHAYPNPFRTMSAFKKADFIFTCDVLPTEPALYADIILPEATFLERADVVETWSESGLSAVAIRFPVVEPMFEAKDPYWIVKQLSARMGKGKGFHYDSVFERLNDDLKAYGLTVDQLYEKGGLAVKENEQNVFPVDKEFFPTPSGKIEFYSRNLQDNGFAPVPGFEPVPQAPPGFIRLLYGRSPIHTLSSTCNNEWLHAEMAENELWLNDDVAKAMGITDGDRLTLENQDGVRSLKPVKIKVTPGIRSDCVFMVHGFGSRSSKLRTAFNEGVSDTFLQSRSSKDPVSGVRGMRNNFVRFMKRGRLLNIPALG